MKLLENESETSKELIQCNLPGNKCINVVANNTPPPNDNNVETMVLVRASLLGSVQLYHFDNLNGIKPKIIDAQNKTNIVTPFAMFISVLSTDSEP